MSLITRCNTTEEELEEACDTLKKSLSHLGIDVVLEKEELTKTEFESEPLESNRIWINDDPLEAYIQGNVNQSSCCDVCGPSDCRTVEVDGEVYETIPSKLIIQAGMIAASKLIESQSREKCC